MKIQLHFTIYVSKSEGIKHLKTCLYPEDEKFTGDLTYHYAMNSYNPQVGFINNH